MDADCVGTIVEFIYSPNRNGRNFIFLQALIYGISELLKFPSGKIAPASSPKPNIIYQIMHMRQAGIEVQCKDSEELVPFRELVAQ